MAAACDAAATAALARRLEQATDPLAEVAAAFPGLCAGVQVLEGQLPQLVGATAEQVHLVDLQTALMDGYDWSRACTGGQLALSMATKLDPAAGRSLLWEQCGLERLAVVDRPTWLAATGPVVIPWIAWTVLADGGVPPAEARPVVRALLLSPSTRGSGAPGR